MLGFISAWLGGLFRVMAYVKTHRTPQQVVGTLGSLLALGQTLTADPTCCKPLKNRRFQVLQILPSTDSIFFQCLKHVFHCGFAKKPLNCFQERRAVSAMSADQRCEALALTWDPSRAGRRVNRSDQSLPGNDGC